LVSEVGDPRQKKEENRTSIGHPKDEKQPCLQKPRKEERNQNKRDQKKIIPSSM
jgi:hypothetical protein